MNLHAQAGLAQPTRAEKRRDVAIMGVEST